MKQFGIAMLYQLSVQDGCSVDQIDRARKAKGPRLPEKVKFKRGPLEGPLLNSGSPSRTRTYIPAPGGINSHPE
jgi:hypothetical protein